MASGVDTSFVQNSFYGPFEAINSCVSTLIALRPILIASWRFTDCPDISFVTSSFDKIPKIPFIPANVLFSTLLWKLVPCAPRGRALKRVTWRHAIFLCRRRVVVCCNLVSRVNKYGLNTGKYPRGLHFILLLEDAVDKEILSKYRLTNSDTKLHWIIDVCLVLIIFCWPKGSLLTQFEHIMNNQFKTNVKN